MKEEVLDKKKKKNRKKLVDVKQACKNTGDENICSPHVGSSPVAFPFFLVSFNLPVFILDIVYTWIYLFESGIRLFNKYTCRNVNNFN